jgi:hypothetical protein
LVIGSIIPDLNYFIALQPVKNAGHTLRGVLMQGVPAGLLLCLIWFTIVQVPFLQTLPSKIACRVLPTPTPRSIGAWLGLTLAIIIGATTHIAWDGFTHGGVSVNGVIHAPPGWAVRRWSWLSHPYFGLPIYKWLQYVGGLGGIIALLIISFKSVFKIKPTPIEQLKIRSKVLAWAGFTLCAACLAFYSALEGPAQGHAVAIRAIIGAFSGGALGVFIYSLTWQIATQR